MARSTVTPTTVTEAGIDPAAVAVAAMGRAHVEVLEVDPVNSFPGGEIAKVEGEADHLVVTLGH